MRNCRRRFTLANGRDWDMEQRILTEVHDDCKFDITSLWVVKRLKRLFEIRTCFHSFRKLSLKCHVFYACFFLQSLEVWIFAVVKYVSPCFAADQCGDAASISGYSHMFQSNQNIRYLYHDCLIRSVIASQSFVIPNVINLIWPFSFRLVSDVAAPMVLLFYESTSCHSPEKSISSIKYAEHFAPVLSVNGIVYTKLWCFIR